MVIDKKDLRNVEIRIDSDCKKEIIDLLGNWCDDDYRVFGGILDLVENVNDRVFLMNYDGNGSFITFDDHSNLVQVDLLMGEDKTIAINKYDERFVYNFKNNKDSIYLNEKLEERIDNSVMKKKRKIHMI